MSAPLRILGFPVHIRSGFIMFMALIVFLNGSEFGVYLALSIAGFTLLHELGHAVAARRAGAQAEISLDFMAGYASYEPGRPISRLTQAGIALAGPGIHVVTGLALLLALGVNPLDTSRADRSPVEDAIWWAGPVIGAFNLLPLLPLDGGNVVTSLLEFVTPKRARPIMLYASLGLTGAAAVLVAVDAGLRPYTIFVALLLIMQLQQVFAHRDRTRPSSWRRAATALHGGDPDAARRILIAWLKRPVGGPVNPGELTDDDVRALVALLPRPLPAGDPWNEYVLASMLIRAGRAQDAAHYAAEAFGRHPRTLLAATVARAAGALGDTETAVAWLRAAAQAGTSNEGLASMIDRAPELAAVRTRPEIVALRGTLPAPTH